MNLSPLSASTGGPPDRRKITRHRRASAPGSPHDKPRGRGRPSPEDNPKLFAQYVTYWTALTIFNLPAQAIADTNNVCERTVRRGAAWADGWLARNPGRFPGIGPMN
jgi:hypothetical protein